MKQNVSLAVLLLAWLAVAGCAGGVPTLGGSEADQGPPEPKTPERGEREEPGASAAAAGCALGFRGPEPSRGSPGEAFRVHGEGFTTDCYDTGQPGLPPPQRDVPIDFRQGERTWRLATVDADREGALDAELEVPEDAGAGSATVVVRTHNGHPVEAPFRVLDGAPEADGGTPGTEPPELGGSGSANGDNGPSVASAAACAAGGAPVDLVADGTVEKLTVREGSSLAEIRVDRVLEGRARDTVSVRTSSGTGGSGYVPHFEEGNRYRLYLQRQGGGQGDVFTTNVCLGTKPIE